jgi:hypothetical protein
MELMQKNDISKPKSWHILVLFVMFFIVVFISVYCFTEVVPNYNTGEPLRNPLLGLIFGMFVSSGLTFVLFKIDPRFRKV